MKFIGWVLLFLLARVSAGQIESFEGLKPVNGTQLYFKIIGKSGASKTGGHEAILVIHGGPGLNHTYFLPHIQSLTKHFTVILFDQRGCGRSSLPSSDSITLQLMVDDIEAIRQSFGIEKVNLLAHSWGAILAVNYGTKYHDKVKSIIFCNPVALSKEFDKETASIQKSRVTSADSTDRSIVIGSPDFRKDKADAYEKLMIISFRRSFYSEHNLQKLSLELQENFKAASRILFTGLGPDLKQFDFYKDTNPFDFPVLVLQGRADVIPLKAAQKIKEMASSSKLLVFDKSGHFIFIEEPSKFLQAVKGFLTRKD